MLRKFIAFSLLLLITISCTKTADVIDYGPTDKKIIEDYLAAHNITNAQSTASGLYYVIQNSGGTNHPKTNSLVSVNLRGYFTDGIIFDSSYPLGKPSTFSLIDKPKGMQEGLQLIGARGKIQLFIPSALGYGTNATTIYLSDNVSTTVIPANSVLVYDIELLDFY